MDAKGTLVAWLNDAYAMEQGVTRILEHRIRDTKDHPQMQSTYRQHLETTRRQADLVKACIERLGGSTSAVKTGFANVAGAIQAISTGPFGDEMVKNCLADYAVENFEIASYRALVAAARELGDGETERVCQQILSEEEQTARWLEQQLPNVVREFLAQQGQRKAA